MFDWAASGGPGSLGYLGYCPCNRMDPAGLWSLFLSAAERSIFPGFYSTVTKEGEGWETWGARGI